MKRKKRKYTNGQTRLMQPPAKYQEGFLTKMDFRTEKFHNLDRSFQQVVSDLGGDLSRLELSLCERFVYIEMLIRGLEIEGANGDENAFLDRYIKLSNSLNSICAKLGISRRKPEGSELQKYIEEKAEDE